jgi:hypothetical protein
MPACGNVERRTKWHHSKSKWPSVQVESTETCSRKTVRNGSPAAQAFPTHLKFGVNERRSRNENSSFGHRRAGTASATSVALPFKARFSVSIQ